MVSHLVSQVICCPSLQAGDQNTPSRLRKNQTGGLIPLPSLVFCEGFRGRSKGGARSRAPLEASGGSLRQVPHPNQIVSRRRKSEHPSNSILASMPGLA